MSQRIFAIVLLLGGLQPTAAQAQNYRSEPPYGIRDEAGLFTKDARATAYADYILPVHDAYHKDIFIETRKKGPNVSEAEFRSWADAQALQNKVHGVYIVITEEPRKIEVVQDRSTLEEGWFIRANADEEFRILKHWLSKGEPDKALHKGLDYVKTTLHEHSQAGTTQPQNQGNAPFNNPVPAPPAIGNHWLAYLCLAIGALLVVWMIFGIIRGMSNNRGGGGGYGGGPGYGAYGGGYGPGYGGGGGGFFSSLMGGMFGAAAGNWMYNNWFGGPHTSSAAPPSNNPAPSQGAGPDYTATGGDWSAPGSPPDDGGAGGDWGGGDAGGGDAGAGGGDWGGGDAGGGGDWGGGDAGGGAGGDW